MIILLTMVPQKELTILFFMFHKKQVFASGIILIPPCGICLHWYSRWLEGIDSILYLHEKNKKQKTKPVLGLELHAAYCLILKASGEEKWLFIWAPPWRLVICSKYFSLPVTHSYCLNVCSGIWRRGIDQTIWRNLVHLIWILSISMVISVSKNYLKFSFS